jgi:hypothetical protein
MGDTLNSIHICSHNRPVLPCDKYAFEGDVNLKRRLSFVKIQQAEHSDMRF